jgi:hypothetical protein
MHRLVQQSFSTTPEREDRLTADNMSSKEERKSNGDNEDPHVLDLVPCEIWKANARERSLGFWVSSTHACPGQFDDAQIQPKPWIEGVWVRWWSGYGCANCGLFWKRLFERAFFFFSDCSIGGTDPWCGNLVRQR